MRKKLRPRCLRLRKLWRTVCWPGSQHHANGCPKTSDFEPSHSPRTGAGRIEQLGAKNELSGRVFARGKAMQSDTDSRPTGYPFFLECSPRCDQGGLTFVPFGTRVNARWQPGEIEHMQELLSITELLGGPKVLGRRIVKPSELVDAIRAGVRYEAFDSVRQAAGLSREEAGTLLGIPPRTLARRRNEGRLTVEESDRIYRLAHLLAKALQVFGDREKVVRWLHKPNRALGDVVPWSRLDTDAGTREIEAILGRLEHGVFS